MSWQKTDSFTLLREQMAANRWEPDDDQRESWMREMGIKLFENPLAQSYLARGRLSDTATQIHTAADVLGERDFRLGSFLIADEEWFDGRSIPRKQRLPVAFRAISAMPYLWTSRCYEVARNTPVPRHVLSRTVLPYPRMWWTLETAYTFFMGEGEERVSVDAWLISDEGSEGFTVFFFGQTHGESDSLWDGQMMVFAQSYFYGMTFPDDFREEDHSLEAASQILGMLAFVNSPYIPKTVSRPNRGERRLYASAHGEAADNQVSFIDLRAVMPAPKDDERDENGTVDWKHRWIVRGHNRAQWYPSEQAHHVIYIAPYMKGPEDAPLLEHAYRVKR